jgi:hypothetical protein
LIGGIYSFGALGAIGVAIGGAVGGGLSAAIHKRQRRRLARMLAAWDRCPFPVEGYDDWLLSGRPIFDVELVEPFPESLLRSALEDTVARVELQRLDDKLYRIETRPIFHAAGQQIPSFWGGDPADIRHVVTKVLLPLHLRVGIVAVRMGGYPDPRA